MSHQIAAIVRSFCFIAAALASVLLRQEGVALASDPWQVGFGKVDITPEVPLRLSGYAVRQESSNGVADPLAVRAMVLSPNLNSEFQRSVVLVSVDSIAVSSAMSVEIAQWLSSEYSLPRSQLAISSTHSHAAPHITGALENLFRATSTSAQISATEKYTRRVIDSIKESISIAIDDREPASISIGESQASFAINRRVIEDGRWTGFGEQPNAPVDRRLRFMQASSADGKLLGGAFMYACHCTTLGGDFNQVSADWAGMSAGQLEKLYSSSIFLPVIGCGADANPSPRGNYDFAGKHAAEIVTGVKELIDEGNTTAIADFPVANFGYAGLVPEQPTSDYVDEMIASEHPNEKRWGEFMAQLKKDMGRLPETYPMPIHTWQFGNALSWVFLGGEVVVEYQYQIEKELRTDETWVAAYTDDVFAYVASEAMREQGGYEVDFSMIYYLQPGRWESGTQSLVVRRASEISKGILTEQAPPDAQQALESVRVPEGYRVELVASEPLVQDPINVAFGTDGRIWVVEMSDYPRGVEGGGRVKWLRDNDGDGKMDESHVFINELSYPTSVQPWSDGVLIISAPNIIYAEDRDGDGKADHQEVLLTGIGEANPQHRASGFTLGLDGWLHLSKGDHTNELVSSRNGTKYDVRGHDISWNPTTGEVRTTSGETQFVRSRDNFGNWFGNSNSRPIYHYVVEDRYLVGNSISGGPRQDLLTPAVAPPVRPRSKTLDRFNDLFALDRFTSACSSIIARSPGIARAGDRNNAKTGFICEPVHNLVARVSVKPNGASYSAVRHPDDVEFDFFTSTDLYSRPVRAINAPDGTLWIVDMTRRVIEHPEWIPTSWQQRLDLRKGSELGRIYRVYRDDFSPTPIRPIGSAAVDLIPSLASENGATRDRAVLAILDGEHSDMQRDVRRIALEHPSPAVQASALGCLASKNWLTEADIEASLRAQSPQLVRYALQLAEAPGLNSNSLTPAIQDVVPRNLGAQVDLQWILTTNLIANIDVQRGLATIAARSNGDPWILKGLSLVQNEAAAFSIVEGLFELSASASLSPTQFQELERTVEKLWRRSAKANRDSFVNSRLPKLASINTDFSREELLLIAVLSSNSESASSELAVALPKAKDHLLSPDASVESRLALANLLGTGLFSSTEESELITQILKSDSAIAIKRAAIEALRNANYDQVPSILTGTWIRQSPSLRAASCATLLSRRGWTEALIDQLETKSIQPRELDLSTIQRLRSYNDRNLRSRAIEILSSPTPRSKVVGDYLAELPTPKRNPAGAELYKQQCAVCHQSEPSRPAIGPPLENLQHWTVDQWVTAVLDPNRNVEPKYKATAVLTRAGQALSGIVIEENAAQLKIATGDGSIKEIAVNEIEDMTDSGMSLMPEGFETKLTPKQLADLLGFLRSR